MKKLSLDDAKAQPWICSVSFWRSNRDFGQPGLRHGDHGDWSSGIQQTPWVSTEIFQTFATR